MIGTWDRRTIFDGFARNRAAFSARCLTVSVWERGRSSGQGKGLRVPDQTGDYVPTEEQAWRDFGSKWNDVGSLPWANPLARHVKVVRNGVIAGKGRNE